MLRRVHARRELEVDGLRALGAHGEYIALFAQDFELLNAAGAHAHGDAHGPGGLFRQARGDGARAATPDRSMTSVLRCQYCG